MKTTVIIPSYNPTLKIAETLEKLVLQSSLIDELIVIVDNNNYNDFINVLSRKYSPFLKMKIYAQKNSGRAKSRNRGVEISSGDIIIFLDDDMLAEKDLIARHIQYHVNNPDIIVSGNGYRNPEKASYDFGKFLINTEKDWKLNGNNVGEVTFKKFSFTACNMSVSKKIFTKLGGFDTIFSDGEDFDFAIRAINKGIRIVYDNTLLAWHNDWPEIDTYIKRQNEYTLAKMEILKVHPEYMEHFPGIGIGQRGKIRRTISIIIRHTIGKWVISKNSILYFCPLMLKFLLYRITISAYSSINK